MSRLSAPFGLSERIRKPDMNLDATAIGTVLLTSLMMVLLVGPRFVYAPGLTVAFGDDAPPASLTLPVASPGVRLDGARTAETLTLPAPAVLALKQDDMAIWNGRILRLSRSNGYPSELEREFSRQPRKADEVLLLKADRAVSMQTLFTVIGIAKKAGFSAIQIAGEDAKKEP